MEVLSTELSGVFVLHPKMHADDRGLFIKTMQAALFAQKELRTDFKESYVSTSHKNVLRGMHFQIPPADGSKLIVCLSGAIQDALLDLRKSSSTYGQHILIPMNGEHISMVYIPAGIAHGFWVEQGPSTMLYYQCAEYAPAQDKGIAWDKCGIDWSHKGDPILSSRDSAFPALADFVSPFA